MSIKSITVGGRTDIKKVTLGGGVLFEKSGSTEPPVLLSWEHVLWSIENNSYTTDYTVGDLIQLDLGTEGNINMQIVAFDADERADGTGKAHITFVSKELLKTTHRMNPSRTPSSAPYKEGTGTIGGWEKSGMRTYLNNTIKPLIPSNVRAAIKAVYKAHTAYDSAGSKFTQTTEDEVWLPSYDEMFSNNGSTNQPRYKNVFPNDASRTKTVIDESSHNAWWLRSAANNLSDYFNGVTTAGGSNSFSPTRVYGVTLCFCL